MADPFEDHELLGVGLEAPPEAVHRAHRKQAIIQHRRGIFRLEERLQRLADVAKRLVDPEQRRRDAEQHELARAALLRLPPEDDRERARRIGQRLHSFKREIGETSLRASREAVEANAEAMRRVGEEHDLREAREARMRSRRALASLLLRLSLVAACLGAALYFWSSH